ncbi:hypothetical protein K469DRAFT_238690 [Zopfia rhizophila CBS 207.26]|uniref:Uncharacterized protein n=1 Tax=Zopfia rhizophila CBS 207.26 TaxID=1314779 RepID=A0A6A6EUL7_9PEZI|nr:hypothetical protein K469DRAFT_238690 [Zopfia rhizophila CBS 207.26]
MGSGGGCYLWGMPGKQMMYQLKLYICCYSQCEGLSSANLAPLFLPYSALTFLVGRFWPCSWCSRAFGVMTRSRRDLTRRARWPHLHLQLPLIGRPYSELRLVGVGISEWGAAPISCVAYHIPRRGERWFAFASIGGQSQTVFLLAAVNESLN